MPKLFRNCFHPAFFPFLLTKLIVEHAAKMKARRGCAGKGLGKN